LWDDNYPHKVYNNTKEIIVINMDIIRPFTGLVGILNKEFIILMSNSKIVKDEIKRTEIQIKLIDLKLIIFFKNYQLWNLV